VAAGNLSWNKLLSYLRGRKPSCSEHEIYNHTRKALVTIATTQVVEYYFVDIDRKKLHPG
jgi:hypothetical protein